MPFTIPNDVPGGSVKQRAQATPDSVDIDILIAGHNLTGVQSGCAVTPQGSPNMTVAVALGVVLSAGASAAVTAGNVTITTADATNPRFDLIVASSAGVKSAVAGTPSASPVFPAVPAGSVALAAIYVAAGATFVATADIVDKRVVLSNAPYVPINGTHPNDGSVTTIWKNQTTQAGRGPALLTISDGLFNGNRDQTLALGHNLKADGTLVVANEAGMTYQQENYYDDASGAIKMEAYQQFTSSDGTKYFRPWFAQYDRTNNKLTSVAFIAGTQFTFSVDSAGGGAGSEVAVLSVAKNLVSVPAPDTTAANTFRVRAAATKGAALTLGALGVDDTTQFSTDSTRKDHAVISVAGTSDVVANVLHIWNNGSVPSVSIGVSDNAARLTVQGVGNSQAVGVLRMGSGGFGDLLQLQQFTSSTTLWSVGGGGVPKWNAAANQATGAGSAALGANSPAVTLTAPYTWLKVLSSDGSTCYIPAWK